MRTARGWGVAPSVLRLERKPGDRWTHKDRLLALALTSYEDDLHVCGHPLSETTDPDNERAYASPPPTRCFACTAIEKNTDRYREQSQPRSLLFSAVNRKKPD